MIFHFQTSAIQWGDDDKDYFESKLGSLTRYLGFEAGDEDSTECRVSIEPTKHHKGDRFEVRCTIHAPHGGKFHAEVSSSTFKEGADQIHDKLKAQIVKFHGKHK